MAITNGNWGNILNSTMNTVTSTGSLYGTVTSGTSTYASPNYTISNSAGNTIPLVIYDTSSREIVRLNRDGTVVWARDISDNEAAEAFSRSLQLGAEISAGITQKVKLNMRDSVFNDLIEIAKSKGSLSADDLTYLLASSKIVEKLKGKDE